jgi:hypothetical protein
MSWPQLWVYLIKVVKGFNMHTIDDIHVGLEMLFIRSSSCSLQIIFKSLALESFNFKVCM